MAKPKLTEKATETQKANAAASSQFDALNTIAQHEQAKKEQSEKTATKGRKDQLVTFNLSVADYEKYKSWFGAKGMSFSLGLRMCLDFMYYEDKAERLILTKSGIRENELNRLR